MMYELYKYTFIHINYWNIFLPILLNNNYTIVVLKSIEIILNEYGYDLFNTFQMFKNEKHVLYTNVQQ